MTDDDSLDSDKPFEPIADPNRSAPIQNTQSPRPASELCDKAQEIETIAPNPGSAPDLSTPPPPPPPMPRIESRQPADPTLTNISNLNEVPGYEILSELGRGGMGVVYKARHLQLDREVALKMVLVGSHASDSDLARFRIEAEAAARLQHPHIVQIYEFGEHQGLPYHSLEFCPGGNLDARLNRTPMHPRETALLVEQLSLAIQEAHEASVIHRDLKPANVLFDEKGSPKITDFGLAKKLDEVGQTRTGAVMGTPSYMAPEQAEGRKDIGPKADVYALGAILYECLTGRPPFKAATALDTILQVIADQPVPPRQLNPKVPKDLETICLKCLAKEPRNRYVSASSLKDDLRRWLAGEPILARPVGTMERCWRWCQRKPAVASALAAFFLLFVVLGAGGPLIAIYQTSMRKAAEIAEQKASIERVRAFHWFYVSEMNLCQNDWERGDVTRLRQRLAGTSPEKTGGDDHRGFEWHYWNRLQKGHVESIKGHRYGVLCVAVRSDGAQFASAGLGELKVWDAATRKLLWDLKGHKGPVRCAAYSPDGQKLVTGGNDNSIRIWDANTGKQLRVIKGHRFNVACVEFSPDGDRLVSGSGNGGPRFGSGELKVWDTRTGKELLSLAGHSSEVRAVAFDPDGARIASASWDKSIKVWDARSGKVMLTIQSNFSGFSSLAFNRNGSRIAAGTGDDLDERADLCIWDARNGKQLLTLRGHERRVASVEYSHDDTKILSGSWDGTIRIWAAGSGKELLRLRGHNALVTCAAWGPGCDWVVSGGSHLDFPPELKIWDATADPEQQKLEGHTNLVRAIAVSRNGQRVVSGDADGMVRIWDLVSQKEIMNFKAHNKSVTGVGFTPDGESIFTSGEDCRICVWDTMTAKLKHSTDAGNAVSCLATSADGQRLATGWYGKGVQLWKLGKGRIVRTFKSDDVWVRDVTFSPDNRMVAVASMDGAICLWYVDNGKQIAKIQSHRIAARCVGFSPDSKFVISGSKDRTAIVWDVEARKRVVTLQGHRDWVNAVAFSPDGSRIATGSRDGTVKLWDRETGQELLRMKGHTERVNAVVFSPNGQQIISGGYDRILRIWDSSRFSGL